MERKPAKMIGKPAKNRRWTSSRQDLPGYEQKPHMRPTTPGERAADREPEGEVNGSFSHDPYLGRSGSVPASKACLKGGATGVTQTLRPEVSKGHSTEPASRRQTGRAERHFTRKEPSMTSNHPDARCPTDTAHKTQSSLEASAAMFVVECMARSRGTVQSRSEMDGACSEATHRLVRIRMLGGVGGNPEQSGALSRSHGSPPVMNRGLRRVLSCEQSRMSKPATNVAK